MNPIVALMNPIAVPMNPIVALMKNAIVQKRNQRIVRHVVEIFKVEKLRVQLYPISLLSFQ